MFGGIWEVFLVWSGRFLVVKIQENIIKKNLKTCLSLRLPGFPINPVNPASVRFEKSY